MELALSVLGIILAVAIAGWEYRRANRAEAAIELVLRQAEVLGEAWA